MPCFRPMQVYRSRFENKSGKRGLVFNETEGLAGSGFLIACRQCVGCRLEKSRQWAIRCVHEAQLHEDNCYITLTFNDENLPVNGSLDVKYYQDFMKRLRFHYRPKIIRYFHCGEYGEDYGRPHYHACLFGHDFEDKHLYTVRDGIPLYTSATLDKIWSHGFSTIGAVTFQSAAYVARYVMKKITGDQAEEHYKSLDPETGEIFDLAPEYTTMSRRPGIGAGWYALFKSEVYPFDEIIMNEQAMQPPKFYDSRLEVEDLQAHTAIKASRVEKAKAHKHDQTPERLRTRETVKLAQVSQLKRNIK